MVNPLLAAFLARAAVAAVQAMREQQTVIVTSSQTTPPGRPGTGQQARGSQVSTPSGPPRAPQQSSATTASAVPGLHQRLLGALGTAEKRQRDIERKITAPGLPPVHSLILQHEHTSLAAEMNALRGVASGEDRRSARTGLANLDRQVDATMLTLLRQQYGATT